MIEVELVPIDIDVPSHCVRVVAMQPFVELDGSQEPFRWVDSAATEQIEAIRRALDIASDQSSGQPAKFTIFPEYSIPGLEAVHIVEERLVSDSWPNNTVIIAGLDGLSQSEYATLCAQLAVNVHPGNEPNCVEDHLWVNCCLVWVKGRSGITRRWIQPKICRAWPEMDVMNSDMFSGSAVNVFECEYAPSGFPCRFMTLICFDWVGRTASGTVCDEALSRLNEKSGPLDWIFVIQHNSSPNHASFLTNTGRFLTDRKDYPFVAREHAVVVHANTSAVREPACSGNGAHTSCVFSPYAQFDCKACCPTVCMQTTRLRGNDILSRCKDVVFREMGSCIHSFKIRVPRFVTADAPDRTPPILDARVHGVSESDDPRLMGRPVPASVKWLNDSLDSINRVVNTDLAECPLKSRAEHIEPTVISDMRTSSGVVASHWMDLGVCFFEFGALRDDRPGPCADEWGQVEVVSLEHVVHTLTALRLSYAVEIIGSSLHGTLDTGDGFVQVVAIRGKKHEDCRLHFDKFVMTAGADPILVVARDQNNLRPTGREFHKFYEVEADTGTRFLDYNTLITCCREAADEQVLREATDEYLPRDRRII